MASKKGDLPLFGVLPKRKKLHVINTLNPSSPWVNNGSSQGMFRAFADAFLPSSKPTGSSSSTGPTTYEGWDGAGVQEGPTPGEPSMSTGSPVLPAVLFISALLLLAITLVAWRPSHDIPIPKLSHPKVHVWVNTANGTFYCADSVLYGEKPGQLIQQGQALDMGYQPAFPGYCQVDAPAATSASRRLPKTASARSESPASAAIHLKSSPSAGPISASTSSQPR